MVSIRSSLRSRWTSYRHKPLQLVRVERFAKCLVAQQRTTTDFLFAILEPRQNLAFKKTAQPCDVRGGRLFVLIEFVGLKLERVRPPALRVIPQFHERRFVGVVPLRFQDV